MYVVKGVIPLYSKTPGVLLLYSSFPSGSKYYIALFPGVHLLYDTGPGPGFIINSGQKWAGQLPRNGCHGGREAAHGVTEEVS